MPASANDEEGSSSQARPSASRTAQPFRFRYLSPLRWGDLDAQQHVNNAVFLDHLQDGRVAFLYSAGEEVARMLDTGILVVSHQIEYLAPVTFSGQSLAVDLWVDQLGGSRFVIGYEVYDGDTLCARARTVATPYDLAAGKLRRFSPVEREGFHARMASEPPLRELVRSRPGEHPHRCPVTVRWSDLDAYGHVNNVKFYDYVQEARIAVMTSTLEWDSGVVWSVARQDMDYLAPLDFRLEPYEVATSVVAVGNRSFTLAAEVRNPASGTVYARARTVAVGPSPLSPAERSALSAWALPDAPGIS
jgi:acyl-CoA thioester hydrolase